MKGKESIRADRRTPQLLRSGFGRHWTDPRTTLQQGLEAVLLAELADNDCWTNLITLANAIGSEELGKKFGRCLEHEEEHLRKVRGWISAAIEGEAGVAP